MVGILAEVGLHSIMRKSQHDIEIEQGNDGAGREEFIGPFERRGVSEPLGKLDAAGGGAADILGSWMLLKQNEIMPISQIFAYTKLILRGSGGIRMRVILANNVHGGFLKSLLDRQ